MAYNVSGQPRCVDCHSNETVWPRYSNIVSASWLIQCDVEAGQRRLNFSEWPTNTGMEQAF
ncbi:MAG: hypothetical protein C0401_07060 [Anaerolinea sp.]|nr:hypothetical protein [Anaerolinea sp.]